MLRVIARLAGLIVVGLVVVMGATAQVPGRPDRGIGPIGSYSESDIESVSLNNGNLNLSLPLAGLPPVAGSKLGVTLHATYNSKLWNVPRAEMGNGFSGTWVQDNLGLDSSGWAISGAYGLELRFATDDFNFLPPQQGDPDFGMGGPWIKFVFHTPDGGEHELRPMDYSGYSGFARTYLFGYFLDTANFLGQQGVTGVATRYYSFDGSYIYAIE